MLTQQFDHAAITLFYQYFAPQGLFLGQVEIGLDAPSKYICDRKILIFCALPDLIYEI